MKYQGNCFPAPTPMADQPRRKKKTTTVIVIFLLAAGALFAGIAAFGIHMRNQWTGAVQHRTNDEALVTMVLILKRHMQ